MASRVSDRVPYNIAYRAALGDHHIPSRLPLCLDFLLLFHALPAKAPSNEESPTGCDHGEVLERLSITFSDKESETNKGCRQCFIVSQDDMRNGRLRYGLSKRCRSKISNKTSVEFRGVLL